MPVPDFTRPTRRRIAVAAIAVTLSLAGCAPAEPTPTITPSASAEPLFSSDKEALAAAEAALTAYWEMSNLISQEGGANPERMAAVVTSEWLEDESAYFEWFRAEQWRQVGATVFDTVEIQQWFASAKSTTVVVTACFDSTSLSVLGESGTSVGVSDVLGRHRFEVVLHTSPTSDSLLVHQLERWKGQSC